MKRNYGIDLLRIVSMFFVIVLHLVGVGGICSNSELLGVNFLTSQFLRTATFCAVNVYALISGYVGWSRTPKPSSLLSLWGKVICFCVGITVLTQLRSPELVGLQDLWKAFTPVTEAKYWYFNAYVGLFFFIPLLNHAVRGIERREAVFAMAGVAVLVMSLTFSKLKSTFLLADGYSVLWLVILYLAGGLLARFEIPKKLSAGQWALLYLLAVLANYLPRMGFLWLKPEYWTPATQNLKVQYTNPTIVLSAVALVGCFSRLELKDAAVRVVKKLSPHSFGVYLAHTHTLIFHQCISGKLAHLGTAPVWEMLLKLFGVTLLIYVIGTAADWAITVGMKVTGFDKLLKKADKFIQ